MAHDSVGNKLHVGDIVDLPCRITGVDECEDFINVALETLEPVHPARHFRNLVVNAKQVRLVIPVGGTQTDISVLDSVEASKSGELPIRGQNHA